MEKREKNNQLAWFTPNGAQESFVNNIAAGDVVIGIFSAANGVGKTALEIAMLGNILFPETVNPWFDKEFYKNFPFPHRGRIASSSKNVEEIGAIQTEIKRWWPVGKYTSRRAGKKYESEYATGDWVVDIMTYEQDPEQFESATLGIMIFDEPPPMKILWASIARMRKGGIILIFMTPLDTGGEILEDLEEKGSVEYEGETIGKVYIQHAEIEENCSQHGIRGQLEHKDILRLLHFYDPDDIEARAKGKPVHMVGRIYPDFDKGDPYIVDDFTIPEEWYRINILDPHDAIPYALSWAALDPTGQIWIYDEFPVEDLEKIYSTSLSIPDYCRIIREKEGRDTVRLRLIDPFFGNKRYSNTGMTVKQEMGEFAIDYDDGDTSGIDLGHKKVREFLKYQKAYPVSGANHPKLHIFKSCRNHWRSMLRYKRKLTRSGEVKDKIVIEETYKHFCDNIRHLCMYPHLKTLVSKTRDGDIRVKVTGPMKDIHIEVDEDETTHGKYKQFTSEPH